MACVSKQSPPKEAIAYWSARRCYLCSKHFQATESQGAVEGLVEGHNFFAAECTFIAHCLRMYILSAVRISKYVRFMPLSQDANSERRAALTLESRRMDFPHFGSFMQHKMTMYTVLLCQVQDVCFKRWSMGKLLYAYLVLVNSADPRHWALTLSTCPKNAHHQLAGLLTFAICAFWF